MEWTGLLSSMSLGDKLLNSFFASASPRTAGFNAIDYGQAHPITLMGTDILMFIGGGSAGTAGGIKVTTACVLLAAMAAEFSGQETTTIGHRSLPRSVTRRALALSFAGVLVVTLGVAALRFLIRSLAVIRCPLKCSPLSLRWACPPELPQACLRLRRLCYASSCTWAALAQPPW